MNAEKTYLDFDNLIGIVDRLDEVPDPFLTIVGHTGQIGEHSLADLRQGARRWAVALSRHVGAGDRVVLCMPTSVDWLQAFFGVLMVGAVAVPMPYAFHRQAQYLEQYLATRTSVIDDCGAKLIVTHADQVDVSETLRERCRSVEAVLTADALPDSADGFEPYRADRGTLALLQYTSGSTGDPKGVMLTHGSLLWNLEGIAQALSPVPGDAVVSWLPLYHDMGLIGGWLWPMANRLKHCQMATEVFLANPAFWLQAITQLQATITVAPNFGYALCVKRIKDVLVPAFDLSRMRTALCGAEPIDATIMAAFQDRFAAAGLRPDVILPVYGLAEATLAVTFSSVHSPVKTKHIDRARLEQDGAVVEVATDHPEATTVVCVGRALRDGRVRIVDEAGEELPDYRQGEVLVQSGSLMKGYFGRPQATEQTLEDGWLHTGDLGFLDGSELYITGRIKDLIITYGRNFHPHDIEWLAAEVKGIRQGCVAAFGVPNVDDSTEEIAVVAETRSTDKDDLLRMRRELRKLLISTLECNPKHIVLVPPRAVPKTTSGKLRRREARSMFLEGRFDRLI